MAIKDFVDFSLFTDPSSGFDLYSNSIRKGLSYDAYGDKRRFKAIVLSEPVPSRPEDEQYFTDTDDTILTPTIEKIEGAAGKRISQFTFKARIVGPNSPHLFLPDPCNSTYADNPEEAQKLIAMHTTFTSNEDTALQVGTELPRKYSVVEVLLNKNVFGYDLQKGTFLNVVINPSAPSIDSNEDTGCDSLKDIFDDAEEFDLNLDQMSTRKPSPWDGKLPEGSIVKPEHLKSYLISVTPSKSHQIAGAAFPTKTYITSEYGAQRSSGGHGGIDFAGGKRTFIWHDLELRNKPKQPALKEESQEPIYSIFDGEVISAYVNLGTTTGFGGEVAIRHNVKDKSGTDRVIVSHYGHIEYTPLKVGDKVSRGQWIANIGSQGSSTGPHLHLQIDDGKKTAVNPMDLFAWEIEKRTHKLRS